MWKQFSGYYIDDDDASTLPKFVSAKWRRDPRTNVLACTYVLRKEDCRDILHSIDKTRVANGQKPYFVKKYLVSVAFLFNLHTNRTCNRANVVRK